MADTDDTVQKQREIQQQQDAHDEQSSKARGSPDEKQPVQAGARQHPGKLPAQHLEKPGIEAELQLQPQFLAPDYLGSAKLKDH
eukprot:gene50725-68995_t